MRRPRRLSDSPLMRWSTDVVREEMPRPLMDALRVMGVTEFELEHEAEEAMTNHDDWRDAIADLF